MFYLFIRPTLISDLGNNSRKFLRELLELFCLFHSYLYAFNSFVKRTRKYLGIFTKSGPTLRWQNVYNIAIR